MYFDVCPGCNQEWIGNVGNKCACGVKPYAWRLHKDNTISSKPVAISKNVGVFYITWDLELKESQIFDGRNNLRCKLNVDAISCTIENTPENEKKLKKLLLFS